MEPLNFCVICLRTDRESKVMSNMLSAYHNKLTDYSLDYTISRRYCSECEHLLRKSYKFNEKSLNAAQILNKWFKSTKKNKTPVDILFMKLPLTSMGPWRPSNSKVFTFTSMDNPGTPLLKQDRPKYTMQKVVAEKKFTNVPTNRNHMNRSNNFTNVIIEPTNSAGCSNALGIQIKSIKSELNDSKNDKINDTDDGDLELICLDDDEDDVILIDDDECPDDVSLNSNDDCDDYLYSPKEIKAKPMMTLDQLADIELSTEDFDHDYISKTDMHTSKSHDFNLEKFLSLDKSISAKLESMAENLNSICENWEITSLTDLAVQNEPRELVDKFIRQYLVDKELYEKLHPHRLRNLNKIGVKSKLANINSTLDAINEKCSTIVDEYKSGQSDPVERLKVKLLKMFNSCGELRAADGFVFDKDLIINSLHTVSERLIKQMLKLFQGSERPHRLRPGLAVALKRVQKQLHTKKYESVFDIEYTTTDKARREEFERRKTYECYLKADFKCEICYQVFKHKGLLEYHHSKSHDESCGSIICPVCSVRLKTREKLRYHMLCHDAVYKCKLCPLVTYYSLSMQNHYEQHKGTIYKCEQCEHIFKSRSVYMYHRTKNHGREAASCNHCGRYFWSEIGLKTHVALKHRDVPVGQADIPAHEMTCDLCKKAFTNIFAYRKHARNVHGLRPRRKTKKPYTKPNMICKVCNKVGHSYGWMVAHFDIEHPTLDMSTFYVPRRPHLCHICGKRFSNSTLLRDHVAFHLGVRFPCPECGRRCPSAPALAQHRLMHGPPALCCEHCGAKFRTRSNLSNHMRSHIGDRRYKCGICGKGFLHRSSIKEHIRGFHNHEKRIRKRIVKKMQPEEVPEVAEAVEVETEADFGLHEIEMGENEASEMDVLFQTE